MKKFSKAIAFKAITLPVLAALLATTINVPFASARGDSAMPKVGLNASAAPVTDVSAARKYRRAVPRHARAFIWLAGAGEIGRGDRKKPAPGRG